MPVQTRAKAAAAARRWAVVIGFVVYLVVPTGIVVWLVTPQFVQVGIYGCAVGALGTLIHQRWQIGLWQVGIFAVLGFVAALISPTPVAGGLFMAACGLGLGLSGRWALHYSVFLMPILLISILINPVPVTSSEVVGRVIPVAGANVGWQILLALLLAGSASVGLCIPILRKMRKTRPPMQLPCLPESVAWYYGMVLAVCLGIASWWVLAYERVPDASWLLLTLVLLLQPSAHMSIKKASVRAVSTLIGSMVALAVALIAVPWVISLITLLLASAAAVVIFDSNTKYWLWVVIWTPAIILLTSQPTTIVSATEFRLGGTLIGAAVAVGLALLVQRLRPNPADHAGGTKPAR